MEIMSRRSFLATAGAVALGTAALGTSAFGAESSSVASSVSASAGSASTSGSTSGIAAASSSSAASGSASGSTAVTVPAGVPDTWDYEADILVIGAGGAGLSVAYAAADAGADVLVLESQATSLACTTYYCYGNYVVCDSDEQRDLGIEDSPELVLEDIQNYGGAEVTPTAETLYNENVILDYAKHTREAYEILTGWGMDFSAISDQTGNTTMRCHQIDNKNMVELLAEHAPEAGANIMYSTKFIHLIVDGNGMVLGCYATDENGQTIAVKGRKATVLATGPLVRNVALMEDALPGASKIEVLSGADANGDGHIAAMELGGALWGRNTIYSCEHFLAKGPMLGTELNQYGAVSVNTNGDRIYNDGSQWNNERTRLLIKNGINPDTGTYFTWSIIDQDMYDLAMTSGNPNHGLNDEKAKYLTKADTIEDLATAIDAPDLPATIEKYNTDLANGGDTVWGRIYRNGIGTGDPLPVQTAPFYAWPCKPCFYYAPCFSFITDDNLQILDMYDQPIGGGRLYGAGEIVDRTIEGNKYLVGSSISFAVTMGMQLGKRLCELDYWDA